MPATPDCTPGKQRADRAIIAVVGLDVLLLSYCDSRSWLLKRLTERDSTTPIARPTYKKITIQTEKTAPSPLRSHAFQKRSPTIGGTARRSHLGWVLLVLALLFPFPWWW